ncbi:hypothetical protein G6F50_017711 [Rhizopus delemar]|uniref:Uncharacterized protein n=1 Tax=Rhizopus delemar TaxID=936053 RepID=A0A9P6XPE3_9FUNG|nr:hypothetical protein G6F54_014501 [Rhizopus delemar]KAG1529859.1 hypothetical protein G6F50_017711 [Rhizopus delemar]
MAAAHRWPGTAVAMPARDGRRSPRPAVPAMRSARADRNRPQPDAALPANRTPRRRTMAGAQPPPAWPL